MDASRDRFQEIVRKIDRVSKEGDLRRALAMVPELLAVERDDPRYSKKKSHFLAALAYRAWRAGYDRLALEFLDVAEREIPDDHLIPALREERENIRRAVRGAPQPGRVEPRDVA